jgi:membrane fusion protein (multidrug efflux system)
VPVRVALDSREVAAHPLQIGLSMKAEVSVRDRGGSRLPELARNTTAYATDVFESTNEQANARVQAIIAANESGAASASARLLAAAPSHRFAQSPTAVSAQRPAQAAANSALHLH